jgi:tight adherence protein B
VTGTSWIIAAALLVIAAAVAAWPARPVLRRLRAEQPVRRAALPNVDLRQLRALVDRQPRRAVAAAGLSGATVGLLAGGPVASFVLAAYSVLGMRAAARRSVRQRVTAARSRGLDDLNALAADLRAGLAPQTSLAAQPPDQRLADLTAAVWRLAESTGAPAADLVERIEADARAAERSRAAAAAQAAGAQATAVLLAALPLGGIGLGYSVGVDPLQVLLHTPLGAACAAGAVALQVVGLLWADRLTTGPDRPAAGPDRFASGPNGLAAGRDRLAAGSNDLTSVRERLDPAPDHLAGGLDGLTAGRDRLAAGPVR